MDTRFMSQAVTLVLVFLAAIIGGILAKRFRQPVLLGYIVFGILIGNLLPGAINREFVNLIGDAGVTLLMFTLGVEFSFHRLRKILKVVSWPAAAQILISVAVFFAAFVLSGFSFLPAIFVAVAASLSSTAIVVKILSEKGEMETIPGEVATGWLVVQDLSVIALMMVLYTATSVYMSGTSNAMMITGLIVASVFKAAGAIGLIVFLGRIGIPWILNTVASFANREIFLLTTVGIVFLSAVFAAACGLSPAMGAFISGLLIAETSQNHAIFSEVRPLRDLFAVVFFVSLGMVLPLSVIVPMLPMLAGFTLLVTLVKFSVVYVLSRFLGYHRKTSFIVALALTQISEFGFIIAREGLNLGSLTQHQYVFLVALAFMTLLVGTPLLSSGDSLYYAIRKRWGRKMPVLFPETDEGELSGQETRMRDHIVLLGYGRVGRYIGRALEMTGIPFLVVDYNNATVSTLRGKGITVVYGDPADPDVLSYANVGESRAVIIAIPDHHTQELVIGNVQTINRKTKIICRTHHEEDQKHLRSLGVSLVVQPEFEAALAITARLLTECGVGDSEITGKIMRLKIEHGLA